MRLVQRCPQHGNETVRRSVNEHFERGLKVEGETSTPRPEAGVGYEVDR